MNIADIKALWNTIKGETTKGANTATRVGTAGLELAKLMEAGAFQSLEKINGHLLVTLLSGQVVDLGVIDGASVPVNVCFLKHGDTGVMYGTPFRWVRELTVSHVLLMGNATAATFSIGENTYTAATLVDAALPAGQELLLTDIVMPAGVTTGSVMVIFK